MSRLNYNLALVARVRASVLKHGGCCTWRFSQFIEPVLGVWSNHPDVGDGICEMLSTRWIERHASGSSLASWLSSPGGIDESKIRQMMQLCAVGTTMKSGMMVERNSGTVNQTEASMRWLQRHGILPCRVMTLDGAGNIGSTVMDMRSGNRGNRTCASFTNEIAVCIHRDLQGCCNNYALLGIYGSTRGHAMAAWVGGDIYFFDPNFGEFYFNDRLSFLNWFPTFFIKSNYGQPFVGYCDMYESLILAPKARCQ